MGNFYRVINIILHRVRGRRALTWRTREGLWGMGSGDFLRFYLKEWVGSECRTVMLRRTLTVYRLQWVGRAGGSEYKV